MFFFSSFSTWYCCVSFRFVCKPYTMKTLNTKNYWIREAQPTCWLNIVPNGWETGFGGTKQKKKWSIVFIRIQANQHIEASQPASQPFSHPNSNSVDCVPFLQIHAHTTYKHVFVLEISCRAKQCAVLHKKCHTNRIGNTVCCDTHIFDYILTVHGNRNLGEK